jgi:cytochrome P450
MPISTASTTTIAPVFPDIDFAIDEVPDFHERMRELREAGQRVVPVRYLGEIAWALLRYEDVAAAYADDTTLPAAAAYRRHSEPVQGRTLLAMEGNEHRVNRLLVSRAFNPPAIRQLAEDVLVPLANEIVDGLQPGKQFDLVDAYMHRYPFSVITRMLGIPMEDQQQLVEWVDGLFAFPWDPELARRASRDFTAYLAPLIARRRRDPAADVISMLVSAEAEGQRLSDEEIFSFIRLLFPAGADTTYLSIGSLMLSVLGDPALLQRLREQPDERIWAVEESLRLNGTIGFQVRYTEREVTIAGVTIPANSWMLYGNASANHDEAVFPDGERFAIERRPTRLLTFGKGVHFCLGSHLARSEMQVSLSVLLDRLQGLRLCDAANTRITHAVLRGPRHMPVIFDRLLRADSVQLRTRIGRE